MAIQLRPINENGKNCKNNLLSDYVAEYRGLGLQPLPIPNGEKRPCVKKWQNFDAAPFKFNGTGNVGLLTGTRTDQGFFCVVDLDLSGLDYHSRLLRSFIVDEVKKRIGNSLMVETGGSHHGQHIWYFLNEPIKEKIQIPINLNHFKSNSHSALEIFCQGSSHGFNVVAPPSKVERIYRFLDDIDLSDIGKHILQIKKDDLKRFVSGQWLKIVIALAEFTTWLFRVYRDGTVDGATIDFGLSSYLLDTLEVDDMELMHLAFQLSFGERYEHDRTEYLLERTADLLVSGEQVVGIGSVVDLVEDDMQKNLLQSMEQLEVACGVKSKILTQTPPSLDPKNQSEQFKEKNSSMFFLENDVPTDKAEEWLLPGVLPAGKFLLLHGPAGMGKTTASCHIADRVIAQTGRPVIYVNLEQKQGDIQEKAATMSSAKDLLQIASPTEQFSLYNKEHQENLLNFIKGVMEENGRARLIIIDSLMAATGGELNQGIVGGAMLFFNRMASQLGCSVILIHHNNKGEDKEGQNKIFGSALIAGAVVMSLQIEAIENCEFARKLVVSKSNLRELPVNTEFIVGQYPGKAPVLFRCEEGMEIDRTAMKLIDQCRSILLEQLIDGEERPGDEVKKALGEKFSPATVSRASKQLGIIKKQVGEQWIWNIPKGSLIFRLYRADKPIS